MEYERIIDEVRAVPVPVITRAINRLQYGSSCRVIFELLFLTGCRINEIQLFKWENVVEDEEGNAQIYWRLGKNQDKQLRKAFLPKNYVNELKYYRRHSRIYHDRLFSCDGRSFARMFNKLRYTLGSEWTQKGKVIRRGFIGREYYYQLKGLRKTFQTWLFYRLYKQWNDSTVAMLLTSKEMKHSSMQMTAHHYIRHFDELEIEHYENYVPQDVVKYANEQLNLLDYAVA